MKKRIAENELDNEARIVTKKDIEELTRTGKEPIKLKKKSNSKIARKFSTKFFITAFLVILLSFLTAFFLKRSFAILGEQNITYQENSNLDYKVYLKKNDFYENEYLDKNMVYVASLIDKIAVKFDYIFKIDKKSNIDF